MTPRTSAKPRFRRLVFILAVAWVAENAVEELPLICPVCGPYGSPVHIVYGLPSQEALAEARAGKIYLGGCTISADRPLWRCTRCGAEWGRLGLDWEMLFRIVTFALAVSWVAHSTVAWILGHWREWRRRRPAEFRPQGLA